MSQDVFLTDDTIAKNIALELMKTILIMMM